MKKNDARVASIRYWDQLHDVEKNTLDFIGQSFGLKIDDSGEVFGRREDFKRFLEDVGCSYPADS